MIFYMFLPMCFLLLVSTWLEVDSLIDRWIDRSIDCWVTGYLVSFHHFFWLCALCPWALWPLRVFVGPSWFCRADFSDGKVQKLGALSARCSFDRDRPDVTENYPVWDHGQDRGLVMAARRNQNSWNRTPSRKRRFCRRSGFVLAMLWPLEGWGTWNHILGTNTLIGLRPRTNLSCS